MISFTFFFIIVWFYAFRVSESGYVLFHNRLVLCLPRFGKRFVHLFFFSFLITLQRYEMFAKNMLYNIKILSFSILLCFYSPALLSVYYKNATISQMNIRKKPVTIS